MYMCVFGVHFIQKNAGLVVFSSFFSGFKVDA